MLNQLIKYCLQNDLHIKSKRCAVCWPKFGFKPNVKMVETAYNNGRTITMGDKGGSSWITVLFLAIPLHLKRTHFGINGQDPNSHVGHELWELTYMHISLSLPVFKGALKTTKICGLKFKWPKFRPANMYKAVESIMLLVSDDSNLKQITSINWI